MWENRPSNLASSALKVDAATGKYKKVAEQISGHRTHA